MELSITKIENAEGVILPKEILDRMQLKDGDTVYLTETPDGIRLSSHDTEFTEAIRHAEAVMVEDEDVLRKLAE